MAEHSGEVVQLRTSRIWFDREHGVTIAEFEPQAEVDLDEARAASQAMTKVTGGIARPLLVDFTNLKSQTKECRDYFAKDPEHIKRYTAVALIVGNPLSRVLANFFMGINRPLKPTRVFDDRDKALAWLARR